MTINLRGRARVAGLVLTAVLSVLSVEAQTTNRALPRTLVPVPGAAVDHGTNIAVVRGVPYNSIGAAKAAAVAGDTITVRPGTYREHNLLKKGVNYYFYAGAVVDWQEDDVEAAGYGIFDDRPIGASTNRIDGFGDFRFSEPTYSGGLGNPNFLGAVVITNAASQLYMRCNLIGVSNYNQLGSAMACLRQNDGYVDLTANRMLDLGFPATTVVDPGDSEATLSSLAYGVWWALGECYLHVGQIKVSGGYCVWGDGPNDTAAAANLWMTADYLESNAGPTYYMSGRTGEGYRSWLQVKSLMGGGGNVLGGGRHYIVADKWANTLGGNAFQTAPDMATSPTVWLTAQKLTATNASNAILNVTAGTVFANVMQYEPLGTTSVLVRNTAGNLFEGQSQFYSGASGNTALSAATTYFFSPNFYSSTLPTTDASAGTRGVNTRACYLRNLYVTLSAAAGSGKSYTCTVMTNGVASPLVATVTGVSATTASDTTHWVLCTPGVEVGLRVVTDSGATGAKINWGFEGK